MDDSSLQLCDRPLVGVLIFRSPEQTRFWDIHLHIQFNYMVVLVTLICNSYTVIFPLPSPVYLFLRK